MDFEELKKRLQKLPKKTLFEELMAIADRDNVVAEHLQQIVSTEDEAAKLFRQRIVSLKRQRRFIHYRDSFGFAQDLEQLLNGLQQTIADPKAGFSLVVSFLQTGNSVFGRCDDSSGSIGDVYRFTATGLFAHFGGQLRDEPHVAKVLVELMAENDYGVCDYLFEAAAKFLSEDTLQNLADHYASLARSDNTENTSSARHFTTLAALLVDPELHEEAIQLSFGKGHPYALLKSAEIFLKADRPEEAVARLEKIPADYHASAHEKAKLLQMAHEKLGNTAQVSEILWQQFQKSGSYNCFEEWSQTVSKQQASEALHQHIEKVASKRAKFSRAALCFLVDAGLEDVASGYIVSRAAEVSGENYAYEYLLPIAKTFEEQELFLAASLIYRALMEDILARAISKYYTHGVRYLKKLDALAPKIESWYSLPSHDDYFEQLKKDHFRKSAFWKKYDGK